MRFFVFLTFLTFTASLLFYFFPQIDLDAARLFYTQSEGFFLKKNVVILFFYKIVPILVKSFVLLALLLLTFILIRKQSFGCLGKRELAFMVLSLLIGPGLIVNLVFKEHFGRARPAQITEFGGSKHFTPAFVITDQCERNCSFVSGHAAVGFYFFTFALLARQRRKVFLSLSLLPGLFIGFARMAQGGHFLSDIFFAGLFTILTSYLIYKVLLHDKKQFLR